MHAQLAFNAALLFSIVVYMLLGALGCDTAFTCGFSCTSCAATFCPPCADSMDVEEPTESDAEAAEAMQSFTRAVEVRSHPAR